MHLAPEGQPKGIDQSSQRRHVPQVEQLELRNDLTLLGLTVELDHERVGVQEDVVAEVGGATRQAAGVRLGLQDRQALLKRIVNVATGGELDDQRRPLAHGQDGLA